MWTNLIVSLSNLIAIPLWVKSPSRESHFMIYPMIASFLYHLSERKHNLPGIYPLNLYHHELLNLDRFCAVMSAWYVGVNMCIIPNLQKPPLISLGLFGLTCLMISERDVIFPKLKISRLEYTFSHVTWHMIAFYMLSSTIRERYNYYK